MQTNVVPHQNILNEQRKGGLLRRLEATPAAVAHAAGLTLKGHVAAVSGMMVEIAGLGSHAAIGDRIALAARPGPYGTGISPNPATIAEVVGFRAGVSPPGRHRTRLRCNHRAFRTS